MRCHRGVHSCSQRQEEGGQGDRRQAARHRHPPAPQAQHRGVACQPAGSRTLKRGPVVCGSGICVARGNCQLSGDQLRELRAGPAHRYPSRWRLSTHRSRLVRDRGVASGAGASQGTNGPGECEPDRTGGGTTIGRGGPAPGRSVPGVMRPQLPLRLPVQWEPFHQRDVPWSHGSMYQPGGHAGPGDGATVLCLCHRARSSVSTPIRAAPRKATLRRIMEVARVPAERAPPSGARRARLANHPHNTAAPRKGAAAAAHNRDGPVPF